MRRLLSKIQKTHLVFAFWCFGDGLVGQKNIRHEVSMNDPISDVFCPT